MKLTFPRAQMLTPDMWRVVRIITVSKMVGGRPFMADVLVLGENSYMEFK